MEKTIFQKISNFENFENMKNFPKIWYFDIIFQIVKFSDFPIFSDFWENFKNFQIFIFLKMFFSTMKKYFSSGFFLNLKSYLSAFQRTQLELQGVSESDGAHISIHRPPPRTEGQITVFIYIFFSYFLRNSLYIGNF